MWNGNATPNSEIFRVDGNGLYMRGNGEFMGELNVSGDFSWKLSPSEGMFMWDGP
jgi:hypothetical protein